jgi:hypothetical protein
MRKHLGFFVLLWVCGCTLFFSCGIALGGPPRPLPDTGLVADFGAQEGLWRYSSRYGAWNQLTTASSNLMVAAGDRLVANFPGFGLYQLYGSPWTLLTPNDSVENLVVIGELLLADFGSLGLWKYDGAWHNLSDSNPDHLIQSFRVRYPNETHGHRLVANFPGQGLYELELDGTTWTQLTPNDTVQALIEVQVTPCCGPSILYADYGTLGLWKYDGSTWAQITSADANLLRSYGGNLVANFPGHGLWLYDGTTWTLLTPNDTVQALIEFRDLFFADYGTLGLWKYTVNGWERISFADPNLLGSLPISVEYDVSTLVANFPGYGGLYQYNYGSSWTLLTSNEGVTNMVEVDW